MKVNVAEKPGADKPKFGTLRGKIAVHDPDWWKPMSEEAAEAFIHGRD